MTTATPDNPFRKELPTTLLEYHSGIMCLRLKEGSEFDLPAIQEQHAAQDELTGNDTYAVLVDATHHVSMSKECREFMAAYSNPRRKATALLTNNNLATIILANFYLRFHRPNTPTRMFNSESEAMNWLRQMLGKS